MRGFLGLGCGQFLIHLVEERQELTDRTGAVLDVRIRGQLDQILNGFRSTVQDVGYPKPPSGLGSLLKLFHAASRRTEPQGIPDPVRD